MKFLGKLGKSFRINFSFSLPFSSGTPWEFTVWKIEKKIRKYNRRNWTTDYLNKKFPEEISGRTLEAILSGFPVWFGIQGSILFIFCTIFFRNSFGNYHKICKQFLKIYIDSKNFCKRRTYWNNRLMIFRMIFGPIFSETGLV